MFVASAFAVSDGRKCCLWALSRMFVCCRRRLICRHWTCSRSFWPTRLVRGVRWTATLRLIIYGPQGVVVTTVESAIFQLVRESGTPSLFKSILPLVR